MFSGKTGRIRPPQGAISESASLPYVLAKENYHSLIRSLPTQITGFEVETEFFKIPFFAAVANEGFEAIKAFLDRHKGGALLAGPICSSWRRYLDSQRGESASGAGLSLATEKKLSEPLIYPVACGDAEFVRLLLASGKVDVNGRDFDGKTAIYHAAQARQDDIVKILLEYSADLEATDRHFMMTPLLIASRHGNEGVAKPLLDNSAEIEARDKHLSMTPLHTACQHGHTGIVQLLVDHGANIGAKDGHFYMTPAKIASTHGHDDIVELLCSHGAVWDPSGSHATFQPTAVVDCREHLKCSTSQSGLRLPRTTPLSPYSRHGAGYYSLTIEAIPLPTATKSTSTIARNVPHLELQSNMVSVKEAPR